MKLDNAHLILVWILFTSTAPFEFYALIPFIFILDAINWYKKQLGQKSIE
jgi:hypothetical protein